ncbi:MAG: AmmeMemoRadiSam system radical SAM enzyme [Treponema sp.]|nr:AmmeMemoRadiSam system radical SAM enzyme [Treponema sp.]
MDFSARYAAEEPGGTVRCSLCPRRCVIASGSFGSCGVRGNKNGKPLIPFYGQITALALDPIEKKPLYHFRPGSLILSIGFAGCNLHCPFCQNWQISQSTDFGGRRMSPPSTPGDIISAALHRNGDSIAYTYSEPLVHIEFLLDCMTLARRHGIANVLVTNGCVNADAVREILALADAANIDLKCFSQESYTQTLGGDLDTVLAFIRLAHAENVHVEVTTLVVPGFNDSLEELDDCIDFIASLNAGPDTPAIPWHLSAYHPDYHWSAPPTDPGFLKRIKKRAGGKLRYVYAGNIPGEENDTFCLHCKALLVRRRGYRTDTPGLAPPLEGEGNFRCSQCGGKTPIVV